jgi:hypothetical protein
MGLLHNKNTGRMEKKKGRAAERLWGEEERLHQQIKKAASANKKGRIAGHRSGWLA